MAKELFKGMRDGKTLSLVLFGEDDFIIIFGISSKIIKVVHLFSIHIMFLVYRIAIALAFYTSHC